MKKIVLVLALLLISGCQHIADKDSHEPTLDFNDTTHEGLIVSMQALEHAIQKSHSASLAPHDFMHAQITKWASELVYLSDGERLYEAQDIYICPTLETKTTDGTVDNYQCQYIYADDTWHALEHSEENPIVFQQQKSLRMMSSNYYTFKEIHFYLYGRPSLEIPLDNDSILNFTNLDLSSAPKVNGHFLIFAIVKGKGDSLYKKYVWVLKEK